MKEQSPKSETAPEPGAVEPPARVAALPSGFVWAVKALQVKQRLVEHLLREDLKYQDFLQSRQRLH